MLDLDHHFKSDRSTDLEEQKNHQVLRIAITIAFENAAPKWQLKAQGTFSFFEQGPVKNFSSKSA